MADQGFDFGPRERREAKRFEPPPWERDQFEELALRRVEQEAAEAEARAAAQRATEAEAAEAPAVEAEEQPAAAADSQPAPPAAEAAEPREPPSAGGVLEEARVTEMLADLAVEEPPATRGIWKVSVATGGVMVAFGAVFLFWGIAALVATRRTGAVGTFGGAVLLLFGAGFITGGVYLVVKNLRQQGVL